MASSPEALTPLAATPLTSPTSPLAATPLNTAASARRPSALAWALGVAGLLPFAVGAAGLWLLPPQWAGLAAAALLAYAAVIVSFLGGIHWGLAMATGQPRPGGLVWGVLPSLLACLVGAAAFLF